MNNLKTRDSNLELLRIICIISIIAGHFVESSGVASYDTLTLSFFFSFFGSLVRVSCSVFIILSSWFLVDQKFKVSRLFSAWLTVVSYTTFFMLYGKLSGTINYDKSSVLGVFLPIEQNTLWFAGCYIILVSISPILNRLVYAENDTLLKLILILYTIFMVIYSTVTEQEGFFTGEIWTFIYLYLIVGYIKRYGIEMSFKTSVSVFLILWIGLSLARGIGAYLFYISDSGIVKIAQSYLWFYYLRIQSLPNLLLAFSLFFTFLNIPAFHSKIINTVSGTTLGIYCFHECPGWKEYLWYNLFKTQEFGMSAQSELSRIGYSIFCVLMVLLLGVVIELIRARVLKIAIEDRNWYKSFNKKIDDWVNGTVEISNKQLATFVAKISVAFALYCLLIKVIVLFV